MFRHLPRLLARGLVAPALAFAAATGAARADEPGESNPLLPGPRATLGLSFGLTPSPVGPLGDRFALDVGLVQFTFAEEGWPFQGVARLVIGGTPGDADGLFLTELGGRREFGSGDLRPFVGGGLGVVAFVTDRRLNPFGYWARAGVHARLVNRMFLEPFAAYGSYGGPGLTLDPDRLTVGLVIGLLINQKPAPHPPPDERPR